MSEENLISSPPALYQLYLRKLGAFGGSSLGNDIYYLKEFVDIFLQDFGEERVIEMLKNDTSKNSKRCRDLAENWQKFRMRWKKFDKIMNKTKIHFDKIENKGTLSKDKIDVKIFAKYSSFIPLIKEDLYSLAIFFIKNSQIQRRTIPNDAWKVLEHSDLKKIDATKQKPQLIIQQNDSPQ